MTLSKLELIQLLQALDCQRVNYEYSKRRAVKNAPLVTANRRLAAKLNNWLDPQEEPNESYR